MISFIILSLFLLSKKICLASAIEKLEDIDYILIDDGTSATCARKCLSKNTIYYYLDSQFDIEDKRNIKSAMNEVEHYTCIRFVEALPEEDFTAYITIHKDKWCWSYERRYLEEGCTLSSEFPHNMPRGGILHMLLHTLGLKHEHQRRDRYKFISINWDNILEGFEEYFTKDKWSPVDFTSMDYDYESVMHYTAHMHAKDKSKPVITIKQCGIRPDILGRDLKEGHLTKLDIQKINMLFPC